MGTEEISFPSSIMGYSLSRAPGSDDAGGPNEVTDIGEYVVHDDATQDDDDSSLSTSSSSSFSYDSDSSDESIWDIAERVERFQSVGQTPRLAELVFANGDITFTDKRPTTTAKKSKSKNLNSSSSSLSSRRKSHHHNHNHNKKISGKEQKLLQQTGLRRCASDQGLQNMYNAAKLASFLEKESSSRKKKFDLPVKKQMKPDDKLKKIAVKHGYKYKTYSYSELVEKGDFFVEMKPEAFSGYDATIARASRAGDLATFQEYHANGKPVQVCNKYRESVVHTVCRRGHTQVLNFLLNEAFVSVRIADDLGRSPMHDVAWTHKPDFGLARKLLLQCPDLLYIKDQRGFTPMNYAGPATWRAWCKFFDNNAELLQPRILI
jgi:hypothetical protein